MIFGYIYELFSHNVYSIYMQYAFIIPLTLGLIPFLIFKSKIKSSFSITLYNDAVVTLTIWSLLKGVLEIYGTTNYLLDIFLWEAILLFSLSIFKIIIDRLR